MKLIDGIIFSAGLASARYHQNHGQWNADKIQKMLELQKNHGKEMMNNKHSSKDDADKADFDNKAVITDTDSSFSYFAPEISSNTIVINNIHHDNVDSNTNSMMNTSDNSVDVTGVEENRQNIEHSNDSGKRHHGGKDESHNGSMIEQENVDGHQENLPNHSKGRKPAKKLESWQEAPIYQVYPLSFYDSNNDGVGDLKGIEQKLDYIQKLGVGSVWLNPVYDSPQRDMGYDIRDFKKIWPTFGSMKDFESMLNEMHKRGIKLIMDIVPNHSSHEHEWFIASSDPEHPDHEKYKDYYVWRDANPNSTCSNRIPGYDYPNNWVSVFYGSAWEWHPKRQQYYLHQFLPEQPDLNLENREVILALIDVIDFWLKKGVDGFRIDAVQYSFEAQHFRDEYAVDPNIDVYCATPDSTTDDQHHDFTKEQRGMHEMLQEMRAKCKEYSHTEEEPERDVVMISEAYMFDPAGISRYYGTTGEEEASFPFNFFMIRYGQQTKFDSNTDISGWSADYFAYDMIDTWLAAPQRVNSVYKEREWPNWVVSNHDNPRLATNTNAEFAEAISVMILSLPGTQTLYYGDELGMVDVPTTRDTDEGGNDRGPTRAPMQWSGNQEWAGFTTNQNGPWLPVDTTIYEDIYKSINVEDQENDENSMLNHYRKMIKMNKETMQLHRGHYCNFDQGDNVLSYLREQNGLPTGYLAMFNFDKLPKKFTIRREAFGKIIDHENIEVGKKVTIEMDATPFPHVDDSYTIELGAYGYVLAEYEIERGHYFERSESVCYVAQEVEMIDGVAYEV